MAKLTWFQRLYWQKIFKPAELRPLLLHVLENPIASILEIGMGDGSRIEKVLEHYTLKAECKQLRYAGVDLFESASDRKNHLRLKDAHRKLAERQIKAHLVPGDAASALPRVVNLILPSDLIVIDSGFGDGSATDEALQRWLPRLVHGGSMIFARAQSNEVLRAVEVPGNLADFTNARAA